MPVAFLPSPASDIWHLGPVPVRAFALCMVVGVLAGLWLTDWRYRRAGGERGIVLNVATVAVPVGIVGARVYSVVTDNSLYFGRGRDWANILRIWQGGLGMAGAVAAGALATWLYCRRHDIALGPLALAAAPALPFAQAIAVWGNWFSQGLYGRPSGLPWAVAIAPSHRASGFQASATFQPIFLYESLLYLLVAVAVAYAIRRYRLPGDRAFALYAGLYATARFFVEAQRVGYTPRLFHLRTNEVAMLVILIPAWCYLVAAHRRRRRRPAFATLPRRAAPVPVPVPVPARPLRPRSRTASSAVAPGRTALAAPASPAREDASAPSDGAPADGAPADGAAADAAAGDAAAGDAAAGDAAGGCEVPLQREVELPVELPVERPGGPSEQPGPPAPAAL
jgi:prolipoprotein diacylglyceryl transferase